jgi:hypothetical protein
MYELIELIVESSFDGARNREKGISTTRLEYRAREEWMAHKIYLSFTGPFSGKNA